MSKISVRYITNSSLIAIFETIAFNLNVFYIRLLCHSHVSKFSDEWLRLLAVLNKRTLKMDILLIKYTKSQQHMCMLMHAV